MSEFELDVTVRNKKDVTLRAWEGDDSEGEVLLDDLREMTIEILEDLLKEGGGGTGQRRSDLLKVLGMNLYMMLFNGNIEIRFLECCKKAGEMAKRLIIRLRFEEDAAELADYPWEYLYTTKEEIGFLSTNTNLILLRDIRSDKRQELQREKQPLRVLVVVSNAIDAEKNLTPVTGAEEVLKSIQELGADSIQTDLLNVPTVDNFLKKIEAFKPHILHFIGHGYYNKGKEAMIALLRNEEKSAWWVSDADFADYFRHMQVKPQLVLLQLCENAATVNKENITANFSRLGQLLVRSIPVVVAMQYPVPREATVRFCDQFYSKLARGGSIEDAVQYGRWWTWSQTHDVRVFGTVLYTRFFGGIIEMKKEPMTTTSTQRGTRMVGAPASHSGRDESAASMKSAPGREDTFIPTDGKGTSGKKQSLSWAGSSVRQDELEEIESTVSSGDTGSTLEMLIETIIETGLKTIRATPDIPMNQKIYLRERLDVLRKDLIRKTDTDGIIDVLFEQKNDIPISDVFDTVIQSMIDRLGEYHEH